MPIGNNLIGNVGSGYRIATALAGQIMFGFVPIPAGTQVVRTGGPTTLPTNIGAPQTGTVGGAADANIDATLNLKWWDDSQNAGGDGYEDKITYNKLKTTVNGEAKDLTGSYTVKMSGNNWPALDEAATAGTGGAILLGNNANPGEIKRRFEAMEMKLSTTTVASVSVEQKNYVNYEIALPQGTNNQDPKKVAIQVPNNVNVNGFLTKPDGSSSMGMNLAASLNTDAKLFTLSGWLKQCSGGTCTATAAGTSQTTSGEVREDFSLDIASAVSKLMFTKYPASGEKYGWRLTLYYDYAVSLLKGTAGTTALTGDLWLVEASGTSVLGGKLANIGSDAAGNPQINYIDGSSESWKLF